MAVIPDNQKIHTLSSDVDTTERGSALTNAGREVYTIQDFKDTISGGGSIVSVTHSLDATDLKSLTAIEVVAAAAAGTYYNPIACLWEYTYGTAPFNNAPEWKVIFNDNASFVTQVQKDTITSTISSGQLVITTDTGGGPMGEPFSIDSATTLQNWVSSFSATLSGFGINATYDVPTEEIRLEANGTMVNSYQLSALVSGGAGTATAVNTQVGTEISTSRDGVYSANQPADGATSRLNPMEGATDFIEKSFLMGTGTISIGNPDGIGTPFTTCYVANSIRVKNVASLASTVGDGTVELKVFYEVITKG